VAVGAGWQAYVGLINITCYYLLGIPAGALLGFKFKLRVQGIWFGMLIGTVLQTTILLFVMLRATWRNESIPTPRQAKVLSLGSDECLSDKESRFIEWIHLVRSSCASDWIDPGKMPTQ
ncbi:hypothetical protein Gorai_022075, partial [Gossypium raimondii]|nr:hypothetical protein [Gossypium raimondii]